MRSVAKKKIGLVFSCTNMRGTRKCTVNLCQSCLRNRYPNISEEEARSAEWKCPKCCGHCNCSVCRSRRGLQPTADEARAIETRANVLEPAVSLPQGIPLTTVAGIELHPRDVGQALQFLEFCSTFQEVLKFGKAEAESLLRDLTSSPPNAQYSSVVLVHTTLLSLIMEIENLGQKSSWFEYVGSCFSDCKLFKQLNMPIDCFSRRSDGYDSLNFSQKLRLLTFLCDEALGSQSLRVFYRTQKEAEVKAEAIRKKRIDLKQRLEKEEKKAMIATDDDASTEELQSAVLRLKNEVTESDAVWLEAKETLLKSKVPSEVLRPEPYAFDVGHGRSFWKLKGHSDGNEVLLQDMGPTEDMETVPHTHETWFTYDDAEKKAEIETYCSIYRPKRRKVRSSSQRLASTSGSKEEDTEMANFENNEEDTENVKSEIKGEDELTSTND